MSVDPAENKGSAIPRSDYLLFLPPPADTSVILARSRVAAVTLLRKSKLIMQQFAYVRYQVGRVTLPAGPKPLFDAS